MKLISEWSDLYDELDELKKIFFEFLKRWTDETKERSDELGHPNRPIIYPVQSDAKEFILLHEENYNHNYNETAWNSENINFTI